MIEVRVTMPQVERLTPEIWEQSVYEQLKAAGIPVLENGSIESGTLKRFGDPTDWGVTIYQWSQE